MSDIHLEIISRYPADNDPNRPYLLFIHGACHGAWCWDDHFLSYFAGKGYASHALSLRGHGESSGTNLVKMASLNDYVEDIEKTVKKLGDNYVLVGHSVGGLLIQKFMEKYNVPRAIMISSIPPVGVFKSSMRLAYRHPILMIKTVFAGGFRYLFGTPERVSHFLFSPQTPASTMNSCLARLCDESYVVFWETIFTTVKKSKITPSVAVIGAEHENIFGQISLQNTAKFYNTKLTLIPDIGHDIMLDQNWKLAADAMFEFLEQ